MPRFSYKPLGHVDVKKILEYKDHWTLDKQGSVSKTDDRVRGLGYSDYVDFLRKL
jgi:hypothetical protein